MLKRIFIQNFALIDTLNIDMHQGLQVITGETGAGKSIILGALRLILGERADVKSIQNAEAKSVVETEFLVSEKMKTFFEENDLDFDTDTIIRREILPTGKSRAFVNDVPVTLDVLKELSSHLIDIHSQFETSNLFSEEYQFKIIDGLSDNKSLLLDYQEKFSQFKMVQKYLEQLKAKLIEGNKDGEYKAYLLNELVELDLDIVNLEEIQNQLSFQENAEGISQNLTEIFGRIDQEEVGVLDGLLDIRSKLSKVGEQSHQFTELTDRFESIFVEFKDILFELQNKADKIEVDPSLLHALQEKVNKVHAMFLKHNVNTVTELIDIREELANDEHIFADLENEIAKVEKELVKA